MDSLRVLRNDAVDKAILHNLNAGTELSLQQSTLPQHFRRLEVDPHDLPEYIELVMPDIKNDGGTVHESVTIKVLVDLVPGSGVAIQFDADALNYLAQSTHALQKGEQINECIAPKKKSRRSKEERIDTGSNRISPLYSRKSLRLTYTNKDGSTKWKCKKPKAWNQEQIDITSGKLLRWEQRYMADTPPWWSGSEDDNEDDGRSDVSDER